MFKTELLSIIRNLGLSKLADKSRYYLMRFKNRKANHLFKQAHPGITLPPPYMVYESFQIDYNKYYLGGLEDAAWIVSLFKPHHQLENNKILDWGCGPARIIRHMPALLGKTNEYFGRVTFPITPSVESALLGIINNARNPGSVIVQDVTFFPSSIRYVPPGIFTKYSRNGIIRAEFRDENSNLWLPADIYVSFDALGRGNILGDKYHFDSIEYSNIGIQRLVNKKVIAHSPN